jgi:recombination protein RecT
MAVNNSLAKKENTAVTPATISVYLGQEKIKKWINGMIGTEKEAQKFVSSIISATSTNLALQQCDHASIVSSALLANALNLSLSPQLGLAYMVPFEDKKNNRTVATFVLGYKGYIQLAIRSGEYKKIGVIAIKEGEFIEWNELEETLTVSLMEDEEQREKAPTVGYYAWFRLNNGFEKNIYWTKKRMVLHADKYSKAFSIDAKKGKEPKYDKVSYADFVAGKVAEKDMWKYSSFWYKDFDAMAFKTMLRQLISKWGIMSIDMQDAYEKDGIAMSESEEYYDAPIDIAKATSAQTNGQDEFDENEFFVGNADSAEG